MTFPRLFSAVLLLMLFLLTYLAGSATGTERTTIIVAVLSLGLVFIASFRSIWMKTAANSSPSPPRAIAHEPAQAPAPQPALDLVDVLDALPVGVMVIGPDGKITAFNAAAGQIFGVPAARAANRALIEIVRSFDLDKRVSATLRDGAEESSELAFSGTQERSLQVATRALAGANGERSVLVIVSDQSRMRELEALRREFVSNVSHELRTPLTAVKLMVETLQSGVDQPDRDQFLSSIAQETERMIALVEDLLDLARLESGKLELRLGAVDVAALCRQAVQAQRARAQSQGIDLECSAPNAPITISADRDKLYQVLVNLVDNALRHTPESGRVSLAVSRPGDDVHIVVSDTGAGIPSTALPHIFERFYVVDPARARSHSGTGLGLAIVRHIIEAHGGTISAQSELGVGTTFTCTLRTGLQMQERAL
jgi:two-component system, OmpR family, phosphate regulon sensor histidine kinase PhoR